MLKRSIQCSVLDELHGRPRRYRSRDTSGSRDDEAGQRAEQRQPARRARVAAISGPTARTSKPKMIRQPDRDTDRGTSLLLFSSLVLISLRHHARDSQRQEHQHAEDHRERVMIDVAGLQVAAGGSEPRHHRGPTVDEQAVDQAAGRRPSTGRVPSRRAPRANTAWLNLSM